MTRWSKEVEEREAVITMLSFALEWEGVCVIVRRYSRETDWPTGRTGGARLGVEVVFEESARAGPEIWDQRNVRSEGLMPGVSWEAERVMETPLRIVWSVPAETCRFTGPVGVLVGAEEDVDVTGGGQFAISGIGTVCPGQGFSCPNTVPLMGPKPLRRGPMLEKSSGGGAPPGVTSSGKIHSVTG
jgi:hypothetical protein